MNITLGTGSKRIELTAHWGYLWFRLPGIGQGLWHRQTGWVFDRWDVIKNDREIA